MNSLWQQEPYLIHLRAPVPRTVLRDSQMFVAWMMLDWSHWTRLLPVTKLWAGRDMEMATHSSPLPRGQDHARHTAHRWTRALKSTSWETSQLGTGSSDESQPLAKGPFSTACRGGSRCQILTKLGCGVLRAADEAAGPSEEKQVGLGGLHAPL